MLSERTTTPGTIASSAWLVVGLLWFAFLLNYADRQVVFSIFPILGNQLHFSKAQLGFAGSIFIWTYSLCMPLTGLLADIVPRSRLVIASLILWSFATLGSGLSTSVSTFLAWRAVMGVVEALYVPAALGMIGVWHPGKSRSTALSIHQSAQFAGIVAGGWFGGWAAETLGWRQGFGVLTAIGIVYAIILPLSFRRLPGPAVERKRQKPAPAPLAVLRSDCYAILLVAFFMFCAMLWIFYGWLPAFIFRTYHLSLAQSGLAATVYLQAGTVIGVLSWGPAADLIASKVSAGRFYINALGLLLCSPFAYLTVALHSLSGLKLASLAFGFFAGAVAANIFAAAYDVVSEKNYGFATGALNMVGGLGGGAGMYLVGSSGNLGGIVNLMGGFAVATIVAGITLIVVVRSRFAADQRLAL